MKVVCKHCNKLCEERLAVKLTEVEYKQYFHRDQSFIVFDEQYHHYTQVCIKCWKKSR